MLRRQKLTCEICEGVMDHFHTIPSALHLPALMRFKCRTCGCLRTIEEEQQLGRSAA